MNPVLRNLVRLVRMVNQVTIQRAFDKCRQVVEGLGRRPVAERSHAPRDCGRPNPLDFRGEIGKRA